MSEPNEKPPGEGAPTAANQADEIKNLKAEMNRKLDNANAQLLAAIEALKPKAPPREPAKKVSVLDDEDAFADALEDRILSKSQRISAEQARAQAKINQLYSDFPELSDPDHAFSKKANEYYNRLTDEEKANPTALENVVFRAATEMGTKPKKQRATDDDSFSLGGSPSGTKAASKRNADPISEEMETIGALMGVDYKGDKARREKLAKAAKRSKWTRYE